MLTDALQGFRGNARCTSAAILLLMMTAFVGIAMFGAYQSLNSYIVAGAPMRALLATETDRDMQGQSPTEVGTNNNPMEWDRHYNKMLPTRISNALVGIHVVYRTQQQLNDYSKSLGVDNTKSWDGSSREASTAFFSRVNHTIYLTKDGRWSYATRDGENYSVVVHELGHAYDTREGNLSEFAKYDFTKEPCFTGDAYLKNKQEAFAQVFTIYLTGNRASLSAQAQKCMADFIK